MDDYELFKESNKELEKLAKVNKPFVAYIQTASNHIPFTVPDKRESYVPLKDDEIEATLLEKSGFKSVAQLNALRYLDFNIGRFDCSLSVNTCTDLYIFKRPAFILFKRNGHYEFYYGKYLFI